jgi:hypothetical protein
MPNPTSKRQVRFLFAVAGGKARKRTSLTVEQAKRGIAEMRASGKSYRSLPERAKKGRKK